MGLRHRRTTERGLSMRIISFSKSVHCFIYSTVVLILVCLPALAAGSFQPVFNPSLDITRAKGAIKIDGDMDDPGWKSAAVARNFVERNPGENIKPGVETEVYITFDDARLYIAFICYDNPDAIRATMCQRDQFYGDDAVCVLLDTYGNASWAYEFFVNPYGVQKDNLWTTVAGEDSGFDLIWEANAHITDVGYQVEIAIPYSSLRFPNKDVQSWRMDFWRMHPRDSYHQYSWAAYDRNEQCWPCQWGTVNGIKGVHPGKGVEILPALVANQSGDLNRNTEFENGDILGEVSLGGKYSVSSDATIEATVNPDFSQIESDAAQIDVNTTIALFYPERRPFFQEGRDLFRTLFNSFYTRTINDPQFAAKFIGRMGVNSIGFLSAVDDNTAYIIPYDESTEIPINTGKSYVNVLRGLRTIGGDSQLGFIITDRRMDGGGSGTILALDGDIRLTRNYSIDGQYVLSHTKEPENHRWSQFFEGTVPNIYLDSVSMFLDGITFNDGKHTALFDNESYYGTAFITRLKRNARNWNFFIDFNQVDPSYRTETGYDPWINYRNLSAFTNYNFYMDKGIFEVISPQIYTESRWKYDGERRWTHLNFSVNGQLRLAQTHTGMSYTTGSEKWSGIQFDDLWSLNFDVSSRLNSKIGCYASISHGVRPALFVLEKGKEISLYGSLDLKPIDRLIVEPNVSFSRSTHVDTGEELYEGFVSRTRIRYQINRKLSLRLVLQYNKQDRMRYSYVYNEDTDTWDLVKSYRHGRAFDIDPLFTYIINSFSIFYIGSTHDYYDFMAGNDGPSDWRLSSRQFFMKLQYLFQT